MTVLRRLLRAYASILFCEHPVAGLLFLSATFVFPNVGLAGALSVACALFVGKIFKFRNLDEGLHLYNALLVGLSLGSTYRLSGMLAVLIASSSLLTVLVTVATIDVLRRTERLPALSVPFVVVATLAGLAAQNFSSLEIWAAPVGSIPSYFGTAVDSFFTGLGSTFFIHHPLAGAALFVGIIFTSRYLAILCVTGFAVGALFVGLLSGGAYAGVAAATGFNFILTAMAVGGVFCVPGRASFFAALGAAALSALFTVALQSAMILYGLPVYSTPFLLATFAMLAALNRRAHAGPPYLLLDQPDLPERSYEKARLARARLGDLSSFPVRPPFYGNWEVYQGFDGEHTHKTPWQHALDFFIKIDGRSFKNDGRRLDDFHGFGRPVCSPVHGTVVRSARDLPDNAPGEMDTKHNWGNFILIRTISGFYALVAHLKKDSLLVRDGEGVAADQRIAACGNSGRSAQPHIHLQVQADAALGSATTPFHLCGVVAQASEQAPREFHLHVIPRRGMSVGAISQETNLSKKLHLTAGRTLKFRSTDGAGKRREHQLICRINLHGQFYLSSETGASVSFEDHSGILAFYNRTGPADFFLDVWTLAFGVTPFIEEEAEWTDAPPVALWPGGAVIKALSSALHPMGGALTSRYRRTREAASGDWIQRARHDYAPFPGVRLSAVTEARLNEREGYKEFSFERNGKKLRMVLEATGQVSDEGIPEWSQLHAA